MKKILFLFVLFLTYLSSDAQIKYYSSDYLYKNRVSVGTQSLSSTPTSVWFRVGDSASNYGFLNPTAAQRDSVRSKGNMYRGTQVFDLFEEKPYWWNGTEWITWTASAGDTAYLVNLSPTLGDTLLFPVSSTEIGIKSFRVSSGKGLLAAYVTDSTFGVDADTANILATRFWVDSLFGTLGGGVGTVTNVATGWGLFGGPITTTGTITPDTTLLTSRLRLYKALDSMQLINQASNGLTETSNVIQLGGSLIQTTTITPSTFALNIRTDAIGGTTQTLNSGINLINTTAAAAGAQQFSPALRFRSEGWKTNATAASQTIDVQNYIFPIQGTAETQFFHQWDGSINGGTAAPIFRIFSGGGIQTRGISGAAGGISFGSATPSANTIFGTTQVILQTTSTPAASAFFMNPNSGFASTSAGENASLEINAGGGGGFFPTSGTANYSTVYLTPTINQTGSASGIARGIYFEPILTSVTGKLRAIDLNDGLIHFRNTITSGGTTGNQTINRVAGTVNFAAAATTLTVTNSYCTTSSIVYAVARTNDGTAYVKNVVPGAGSFVITLGAAATAETSVGFIVFNN